MQSLYSQFYHSFDRYGSRPALNVGGKYFTYRQTLQKAANIMAVLPKDETKFAVCADELFSATAAALAVLSAGATFTAFSVDWGLADWALLAKNEGVKTLLAARKTDALADWERETGVKVLEMHALPDVEIAEQPPIRYNETEAAFFYEPTPNGWQRQAVLSEKLRAFESEILEGERFGFKPHDRFLQTFGLWRRQALFALIASVCLGACCYILPPNADTKTFGETLEDCDITILPAEADRLLALVSSGYEPELPALKYTLAFGQDLSNEQEEGWKSLAPNTQLESLAAFL